MSRDKNKEQPRPFTLPQDPVFPETGKEGFPGTTVRELYAGLALHALLASESTNDPERGFKGYAELGDKAVGLADALIASINNTPTEES